MTKLLYQKPGSLPARTGRADGRRNLTVSADASRVLDGDDDLAEWDNEELRRGRRRDKDGKFRGRPPRVIPMACHEELYKRVIQKARGLLMKNLPEAVKGVLAIAMDTTVREDIRLQAYKYAIDKMLPNLPEQLEITTVRLAPWQQVLEDALEVDWNSIDVDTSDVVDVQESAPATTTWDGDPESDDAPWDEEEGVASYSEPPNAPYAGAPQASGPVMHIAERVEARFNADGELLPPWAVQK